MVRVGELKFLVSTSFFKLQEISNQIIETFVQTAQKCTENVWLIN